MMKILTEEFYKNDRQKYNNFGQRFLNNHKWDWFNFINQVLKYVYEPLGRYKTVYEGGRKKTGVFTEDGEWHPILNRINTNYSVIGLLLKEAGIRPDMDTNAAFNLLKIWFRTNENYKSAVSEDGWIYKNVIYPTISRTSYSGEKREENAVELLKDCPLFANYKLTKVGGSGVLDDMTRGVDLVVHDGDITNPKYTVQIKPFTSFSNGDYVDFINGVGNAKKYLTDFIAFINGKKVIVVYSEKATPQVGSYKIKKDGLLWSKGVNQLNESIDIIRNMMKKV